jgi:uncharacterized membrane protein YgaE (UPF0421/DUF939 family)
MKKILIKSLKIVFGATLSIIIAELAGLDYSSAAGILCIISIFETRRQTLRLGLKRIAVSFLAIVLSAALFYFGGHNIYIFGLFLFLYVPLLTLIKSSENLVIGAVLASHIYTFESIGLTVILNETALVLIGVSCAMATSVYMLNLRKSIIQKQEETEALLRKFLRNIKKQLIHQCSSEEQSQLLEKLDGCITTGLSASIEDNNNYILKDNSYYIMYFQMRREQYQILLHMNGYLKEISITDEEAHKLFDFTEQLANELEELNPANELIRRQKKWKNTTEWLRCQKHGRISK